MEPLTIVEPISLVILGTFLALMLRRGLRAQTPGPDARRRALQDIGLLAAGAFLGEETCIRLYDFYQYDAPWRLMALDVPLLVALIWPFVILSAREVAHALGLVNAKGRPHVLAVGFIVLYDACLVEPVAVRAGLWSWNEPGNFDVPFIGLLGWAFYAMAASALLDRLPAAWNRRVVLVVVAPLLTHAALLVTWWAAFRWGLRSPLHPEASTAASVALASSLTAIIFQWRKRKIAVDLDIMVPRMMAAALFFGLLFWRAGAVLPLIFYGLPFAGPYLMATRFRRAPAPSAPGSAQPA